MTKKKKTQTISIIIILVIIIISITTVIIIQNQKRIIEENKLSFKSLIPNPDRIVYKVENEDKYYEFKPEEEIYQIILGKLSEKIGATEDGQILTSGDINKIHLNGSFIEFDYQTKSKNFLIPFNEQQMGLIKMLDSGGQVIKKQVSGINNIKNEINKHLENRTYYTMQTNEQYISNNKLQNIEYKYLQQFKRIDDNGNVYQQVIKTWEDYQKYKEMCQLSFNQSITENQFDKHEIVLTLTIQRNIAVEINIGNIQYTYSGKENNYEYMAHALIVSKIVNTDCIYHHNQDREKEQLERQEWQDNYNTAASNLDTEIFETDLQKYETQNMQGNNEVKIDEKTAKEIADKAFVEAERIAGQYDENTQTITIDTVKPNNFFTRKMNEYDKVYTNTNVKSYIATRTDEMGNGISICIDATTGKVIGGKAFGD